LNFHQNILNLVIMASSLLSQSCGTRLPGGLPRLIQVMAFVCLAGFLASCQLQQPAGWNRQAPYQQTAPVLQPTPPQGLVKPRPPAQQPLPMTYTYPQTAAAPTNYPPAAGNDRWNSGNTWQSRQQQATPINARGAGTAWKRGSRQVPGQYSAVNNQPPSQPANTWQQAPYYNAKQLAAAPIQGTAPLARYKMPTTGAAYNISNTGDPAPSTGGSNYTIQPGDTLSGIASIYGVSVAALKQTNSLVSNKIFHGASLIIPGR
jgi:LysM repeat protein